MSQSIADQPVPLTVAFPQPAVARPSRPPASTRVRAYVATLRRDPRDPQVLDLRERGRGGQPDVRLALIRAQARIYASR